MKSLLKSSTLALLALATPLAASAQSSFGFSFSYGNSCVGSICQVAGTILYLINNVAVPLLFAIAFIVFLYGIAKAYIFSGGNEEAVKDGHRLVLWGVIGFVVMISLWGLVNIVSSTFGLGGYSAPPLPTSSGYSY